MIEEDGEDGVRLGGPETVKDLHDQFLNYPPLLVAAIWILCGVTPETSKESSLWFASLLIIEFICRCAVGFSWIGNCWLCFSAALYARSPSKFALNLIHHVFPCSPTHSQVYKQYNSATTTLSEQTENRSNVPKTGLLVLGSDNIQKKIQRPMRQQTLTNSSRSSAHSSISPIATHLCALLPAVPDSLSEIQNSPELSPEKLWEKSNVLRAVAVPDFVQKVTTLNTHEQQLYTDAFGNTVKQLLHLTDVNGRKTAMLIDSVTEPSQPLSADNIRGVAGLVPKESKNGKLLSMDRKAQHSRFDFLQQTVVTGEFQTICVLGLNCGIKDNMKQTMANSVCHLRGRKWAFWGGDNDEVKAMQEAALSDPKNIPYYVIEGGLHTVMAIVSSHNKLCFDVYLYALTSAAGLKTATQKAFLSTTTNVTHLVRPIFYAFSWAVGAVLLRVFLEDTNVPTEFRSSVAEDPQKNSYCFFVWGLGREEAEKRMGPIPALGNSPGVWTTGLEQRGDCFLATLFLCAVQGSTEVLLAEAAYRCNNKPAQVLTRKLFIPQCCVTNKHNYLKSQVVSTITELTMSETPAFHPVLESLNYLCVSRGLGDKSQSIDELVEQQHISVKRNGIIHNQDDWEYAGFRAQVLQTLEEHVLEAVGFHDEKSKNQQYHRGVADSIPEMFRDAERMCTELIVQNANGIGVCTRDSMSLNGQKLSMRASEVIAEKEHTAKQAWVTVRNKLNRNGGDISNLCAKGTHNWTSFVSSQSLAVQPGVEEVAVAETQGTQEASQVQGMPEVQSLESQQHATSSLPESADELFLQIQNQSEEELRSRGATWLRSALRMIGAEVHSKASIKKLANQLKEECALYLFNLVQCDFE